MFFAVKGMAERKSLGLWFALQDIFAHVQIFARASDR
jgi:hypothetical protein